MSSTFPTATRCAVHMSQLRNDFYGFPFPKGLQIPLHACFHQSHAGWRIQILPFLLYTMVPHKSPPSCCIVYVTFYVRIQPCLHYASCRAGGRALVSRFRCTSVVKVVWCGRDGVLSGNSFTHGKGVGPDKRDGTEYGTVVLRKCVGRCRYGYGCCPVDFLTAIPRDIYKKDERGPRTIAMHRPSCIRCGQPELRKR